MGSRSTVLPDFHGKQHRKLNCYCFKTSNFDWFSDLNWRSFNRDFPRTHANWKYDYSFARHCLIVAVFLLITRLKYPRFGFTVRLFMACLFHYSSNNSCHPILFYQKIDHLNWTESSSNDGEVNFFHLRNHFFRRLFYKILPRPSTGARIGRLGQEQQTRNDRRKGARD